MSCVALDVACIRSGIEQKLDRFGSVAPHCELKRFSVSDWSLQWRKSFWRIVL